MSAVKVKRLLTGSMSETVTARLNAAGAFATATKQMLDRVVVTRTDATGLYAFDPAAGNGLVPNAEITPAGTAWVIAEPGGHIVTVVVLANPPPGGWDVAELEVSDPGSPDPVTIGAGLINLVRNPDLLITGAVTRDANGAPTGAPVTWPDGTPGNYVADVVSTAFPGAVDAWHVTYGAPVTRTYTQPQLTRDSRGNVTNLPAIVVS